MHNVSRQKSSHIHFQSGPFPSQTLHNGGHTINGYIDQCKNINTVLIDEVDNAS